MHSKNVPDLPTTHDGVQLAHLSNWGVLVEEQARGYKSWGSYTTCFAGCISSTREGMNNRLGIWRWRADAEHFILDECRESHPQPLIVRGERGRQGLLSQHGRVHPNLAQDPGHNAWPDGQMQLCLPWPCSPQRRSGRARNIPCVKGRGTNNRSWGRGNPARQSSMPSPCGSPGPFSQKYRTLK